MMLRIWLYPLATTRSWRRALDSFWLWGAGDQPSVYVLTPLGMLNTFRTMVNMPRKRIYDELGRPRTA